MRYWVSLVAALSMLCSPAVANYEDGLKAFNDGDFAAAFVEWRASAAEGDGNAQFQLGRLYEQGLGVPQNFIQAHAWYSVAAAKGNVEARSLRDTLGERMTPAQHEKSQKAAARIFSANPSGGSAGASTTSQAGGGQSGGASSGSAGSGQSGTQTTALPPAGDRFDGDWRGGGRTDSRSPRTKCGSGPKLQLIVDGKSVRGKLILVIPGKNQAGSEVLMLKGRIDDQGRFKLEGRETEVTGRLVADRGQGNGEWNFATRRCSGDFQVTKRS